MKRIATEENIDSPHLPAKTAQTLPELAAGVMPAIGSASSGLLLQASLLASSEDDVRKTPEAHELLKNTRDAIAGVRAGGGVEEILSAQAVAFNSAAMTFLNRAMVAQSSGVRDQEAALAVKLAKTSAAVLSVLSQSKSGTTGKLAVGQVNVQPGSQAVVGNLTVLREKSAG